MTVTVGRSRLRERKKSRLREAFEEELSLGVSRLFEDHAEAERLLRQHKRLTGDIEKDRVTIESHAKREKADLEQQISIIEKEVESERERLRLATKRKERMEHEGKDTEVVESEMVTSTRQIFELQERRSRLEQTVQRLEEDKAEKLAEKKEEETRALEDLQSRLKELERK